MTRRRWFGGALNGCTTPEALVVDELGYPPVDRAGADLRFQVFTARYEQGSTIITTNRPFSQWSHPRRRQRRPRRPHHARRGQTHRHSGWRYTFDLPANYQADFIRLFGPPVP